MPKIETVGDLIYLAYANLAMAHSAVAKGQRKYAAPNFAIRAKLLKGLRDGTMSMRSIFDDEKTKLQAGQACSYCGSAGGNLALDHIFPRSLGGKDDAENLVLACRSCNSSKGKKDLMEWMAWRGQFLPLSAIRRYLKMAFRYCDGNGLLGARLEDLEGMGLPFKPEFIPLNYPSPGSLKF